MLAGCKQDAIFTDLLAKLSNFGLQVFNDLVLRAVKELCMDPSRLPRSAFVATVDCLHPCIRPYSETQDVSGPDGYSPVRRGLLAPTIN